MKKISTILLLVLLMNLNANSINKKKSLDGFFMCFVENEKGTLRVKHGEGNIYVGKELLSFRNHLKDVKSVNGGLLIELTETGKITLSQVTQKLLNKRIALLIKNTCQSASIIRTTINGGRLQISIEDPSELKMCLKHLKEFIK